MSRRWLASRSIGLDGDVVRRRETKKERAPFGVPREVVLLSGRDVWPYTFIADDSGGGCGKVAMPADAAIEDVQAAVFTRLADLTRAFMVSRSASSGPP